jgi:hypothetical protein
MADMLFHGLRTLLGPECVDVNKLTFMYRGEPYPPFYTVYGLLPDIEVDRDDIVEKIQARWFDAVVYGSIQRCQAHFELVRALYPRDKIAFVDGEDDTTIVSARGCGWYFKRELALDDADLLPIEFAVPAEKIRPMGIKSDFWAACDPRDRATYKFYGDEGAYYRQYNQAYFGYTMKKGGWDCCRHYEIMAAGALPYFAGLAECPPRTMNWLPKRLLLEAKKLAEDSTWENINFSHWAFLMSEVQRILSEALTTAAMAKRVLERLS